MFYGIELTFSTLKLMNYAVFFEFIGITTVPVFCFLFATRYSGNEKWLSPIKSFFLFIIPAISFLAVATNNLHHLFYTTTEITNTFGYFHRVLEHGILWWVNVIYSHILVVSGIIQIASMLFKQTHISKVRVTFILLGVITPYSMNTVYVIGFMPFDFLDLTPIAFIFMGIVLTLGIFMTKLFDITPLALDKLFDNIPDAIFVLDPDNYILNANPQARKLIKSFTDKKDKNPENSVAKMITDFINKHGIDAHFEFESSFFEISRSEILNGSKNKIGDLIILRDITDRKNAENEHMKSEKNYRLIAENSSDVIWTMDLNGNYHYVSPSVYHMLGYTAEENILQPITENLLPESLELAMGLINYAAINIKNQIKIEPHTVELQQRHKNGSIIWTEVVISPIYDKDDEFKYFLGVTRNISNRKQIELDLTAAKERAEESDRLKSAFLANMSHEIRTPMNGILGFLELLKIMKLSEEDKKSYIRIIEESGHRLLDTINDIIEISKIESGQLPLQISDVNIESTINSHYLFFKHQTEEKGIQLINKCKIEGKHALIKTDKIKLDGILTNLIRNAIKFTKWGQIEIGNEIRENEIHFYIKDTGIGIPADKQTVIFDRFVQADENNTRCYEGSGLGLSIVKGYIQMLGGDIWVESKENAGSTFFFKIPYNPSTNNYEPFSHSSTGMKIDLDFSGIKVLLAEDDNTSSFLIKEILNYYNIKHVHVKNGVECVRAYTLQNDISLILMDLKMPYMDGFEAAKKIKGMNIHVPIIALTAYALEGDRKKAIEAGCTDFITKPINTKVLLEAISKWALAAKN